MGTLKNAHNQFWVGPITFDIWPFLVLLNRVGAKMKPPVSQLWSWAESFQVCHKKGLCLGVIWHRFHSLWSQRPFWPISFPVWVLAISAVKVVCFKIVRTLPFRIIWWKIDKRCRNGRIYPTQRPRWWCSFIAGKWLQIEKWFSTDSERRTAGGQHW